MRPRPSPDRPERRPVTAADPPLHDARVLVTGGAKGIGKAVLIWLFMSLIYDTLDNRVRPTRGLTAAINADVAGLGGDVTGGRAAAALGPT